MLQISVPAVNDGANLERYLKTNWPIFLNLGDFQTDHYDQYGTDCLYRHSCIYVTERSGVRANL